jgi:ergothioneine biosynthesis protein EgtB
MDIKHVLSVNPLRPAYRSLPVSLPATDRAPRWRAFDGGIVEIGHRGSGFAFDNESPRHAAYLEPFAVADRLVSCGEWLAFIADDGYTRPDLWLSDGWATVRAEGWDAPAYWERDGDDWSVFTLSGMRAVDPAEPVCHVSYYEADAFARWADARLPTESEWEHAAGDDTSAGHFLDLDVLHPRPPEPEPSMFGDVWQWTASAYLPYPRFRPAAGAVGEYNGKFMVNQHVLRGGCSATPPGHTRPTYRNFFPPSARWAFSGVRLARDA